MREERKRKLGVFPPFTIWYHFCVTAGEAKECAEGGRERWEEI